MKKKIIYLMMLVFLVLSLASCHGTLVPSGSKKLSNTKFEVPESFDTSKNYEITFWAKNDSNNAQKQIYYNAISEFEKIYPNIKVKITSYTNYNDIYRDVLKNISTNSTPNVCIAYPDNVATYKTGENMVVPLDDLINNEKYGFGGSEILYDSPKKSEVIAKYLDEGLLKDESEKGKSYYTIPFMRSDEVLYVNKSYLEENGFEIPEIFTWDYLFEVCRYARNKYDDEHKNDKGYKRDAFIPLIYKSVDNMFIQLCKQYGYDYTTEDGDILFDNPNTRAMIKKLWGYTFVNEGLFDVFDRVSYPGNKFNKKECIFAIDSSAGATWIGSDAPLTEVEASGSFETIVCDVPQDDTSGVDVISQGPSICLFNKSNPQEVLASWIFAMYLLTNDTQIAYAKTEGYSPVTYKAINNADFQNYLNNPSPIYKNEATNAESYANSYYVKIAATKNVIKNIENSFVTPAFNGSALVRNACGGMIFWMGSPSSYPVMDDEHLNKLFKRAKDNCNI